MKVAAPKGPPSFTAMNPRRASIGLIVGGSLLALAYVALVGGRAGGRGPRARPAFDDVTGRPLNKAAERLVASATGGAGGDVASVSSGSCDVLDAASPVRIARGTWKYVLVSLTAPGCGGERVVVRNTKGLKYHAEMFEDAMELLRPLGVEGRVLGGGRIAYGEGVEIYGYSKTFGRCEGCNERAAAIIEGDGAFHGVRVTWSNEGY